MTSAGVSTRPSAVPGSGDGRGRPEVRGREVELQRELFDLLGDDDGAVRGTLTVGFTESRTFTAAELRALLMAKSGLPPEDGATEERRLQLLSTVADVLCHSPISGSTPIRNFSRS